jgi:hypothetical protein
MRYSAKQQSGTPIFSAVDMEKKRRYSASSVGLASQASDTSLTHTCHAKKNAPTSSRQDSSSLRVSASLKSHLQFRLVLVRQQSDDLPAEVLVAPNGGKRKRLARVWEPSSKGGILGYYE